MAEINLPSGAVPVEEKAQQSAGLPSGAVPVEGAEQQQGPALGGAPVQARGTSAQDLRRAAGPSSMIQFMHGINTAIGDFLDLPTNTITDALSAFGVTGGPRGQTREMFAQYGMAPVAGQEPDTMAFAAGHMAGMSLPFLAAAPAGATVQAGKAGAPVLGSALREVARSSGQAMLRSPVTTTMIEMGSAAAAGAAGFFAKEQFPDSPAAETVGALLGGLSVAAAPSLMAKGAVKTVQKLPIAGTILRAGAGALRRIAAVATPKGATTRAKNRVERAMTDPEAVRRSLEEPGTLPEAPLTPAQRTGDPGLLALERSVLDSSDDLRIQSDQQIAELNAIIRQSMEAPAGAPESARKGFEEAQGYMTTLLDGRLKIAGLEADRRIAALGAGADEQQASVIVREEIEKALGAARATERQLYEALNPDIELLPTTSVEALKGELRRRGRTADEGDIPEFVSAFLGKIDSNGQFSAGRLSNGATFDELRVLRSRVLREIREEQAKPAPNRNKIRILDDIQDAILADLSATEGGPELRVALAFSRDLNDRFSRGPVGRALGNERRGGPALAPELTLTQTLGMTGPKAAENARSLIAAVRDAPGEASAAMSDFIKARFLQRAVRQGQITETGAESFLRDNRALLDEFPVVRREIEQAVQAGNARNLIESRASRVGARLAKPSVSKATVFIQRGPTAAFEATRSSRNPGTEMQNLINMTKRDATGEATEGLRASFVDWLMARATVPGMDATGQSFISGARLQRALEDPGIKAMTEKLMTPEQVQRLGQVMETAKLLDKIRAARPSVEGIIEDTPNILIENMARIGVLRLAAKASGGFGTIQVPGMISNRVRDLLRSRVKDPASRLIVDAITADDPALLQALMSDLTVPANVTKARRVIHAWLAAVLFETGLPMQDAFEAEGPMPDRAAEPPSQGQGVVLQ